MAGPQLPREVRNAQTKHRNAVRKATNIKKMNEREYISPRDQLEILNYRLGFNQGAKRERERLIAQLLPQKA